MHGADSPVPNLKDVFQIKGTNDAPSREKINIWKKEGIAYSHDEEEHHLSLPVRNLTDLFFANFMANVYAETEQANIYIAVGQIYFGRPGNDLDFDGSIEAFEEPNLFTKDDVLHLRELAGSIKDGSEKISVATIFSQVGPMS